MSTRRPVCYSPPGGKREWGFVSSVNDTYVFVLYAGDRQAKATHPAMLDLVDEIGQDPAELDRYAG
jgi:sensor domain CHASE-containing protein